MPRKLIVWWIPQVPMKAFEKEVTSYVEAKLLLDTLAEYDLFQFNNKVKGDYANVGGLAVETNGDREDWYPSEDEQEVLEELFPVIGIYVDSLDNLTLEQVREFQRAMQQHNHLKV